jgi:hypothetical protein
VRKFYFSDPQLDGGITGSGGGGVEETASPDEGLTAEEWVKLWADTFKNWSESDRKFIGNAMVAAGAAALKNLVTCSAGEFLMFLGAAIVEGDVDSAAFYCDQLERTYLNQKSKEAVLAGLQSILEVAKIFKGRF